MSQQKVRVEARDARTGLAQHAAPGGPCPEQERQSPGATAPSGSPDAPTPSLFLQMAWSFLARWPHSHKKTVWKRRLPKAHRGWVGVVGNFCGVHGLILTCSARQHRAALPVFRLVPVVLVGRARALAEGQPVGSLHSRLSHVFPTPGVGAGLVLRGPSKAVGQRLQNPPGDTVLAACGASLVPSTCTWS